MSKKKKIIFIILIVVLLIFGIIVWFVMDKLNRIDYSDGDNTPQAAAGEENIEDAAKDASEEEEFISQEELEELGLAEVKLADMDIFTDSNVFNVLLLGTDERKDEYSTNARADSIMLLSVNKETKNMKLVSLERGMGVPILEGQYQGQYDWLTHCFRYGGANLMLKEVQECLRVDVNRYVRVNFNSFAEIIDAIGGVDIELTALEAQGLNGEVRTNARTKHKVTEGMNHLDGYDALQYARLRYIDSDWKRIERQRNVIQTVVHKAKDLNLLELNEVADMILPLINTNLTKSEVLNLVLFAPNVIGKDIEQMSIPKKGTYGGMKGMGGRSLYAVDFETNANILREFLYEK